MPSQADTKEVADDGKVSSKRRFDARDWQFIAEYVIEECDRRKNKRKDRERHWKDIDRQIAMEPDIAFKMLPNGKADARKLWMSEMELPLQAQALEVLTADARRMMEPDSGLPFRAHGEMTDKYLEKADFGAIVHGDELEVPSQINQDNCDKLIEGFVAHQMKQYAFFTRLDMINAGSFKYGMGVGRARKETKNVYIHEARGVRTEKQRLPVLVPCSIKNVYLDDPIPSMHSAQMLGPAHIAEDHIKLENLHLAVNKGSANPDDDDGGWMPANMKKLMPNDDGNVRVLELEGDLVVPRKTTRSMVLPGCIVTVAAGGKDSGGSVTTAVIRFRWRKAPFSSYLLFPYHYEGSESAYPASPLMKGRPIQIMATDALNRLMDSAALKNAPPVGYDRNDVAFAQSGGPEIYPYAQWNTIDPVRVHDEVGGDPSALASIFTNAVHLYAELTGVLPARLGAQTVSHTTAFAKDAELQRGAVRTVDYVRQCSADPLTRWLDMAYQMGRELIGKREEITFFIDAYGGFVKIGQEHLPERSTFEWFGSGGPAEETQKRQMMLQSLGLAMQMDQANVALTHQPPTVNIPSAIKEVLRRGGWTDIDAIVAMAPPPQPPGTPAIPGVGSALTGLQNIAGQVG